MSDSMQEWRQKFNIGRAEEPLLGITMVMLAESVEDDAFRVEMMVNREHPDMQGPNAMQNAEALGKLLLEVLKGAARGAIMGVQFIETQPDSDDPSARA